MAAIINAEEHLTLSSAVRGFHIYKEHWSPVIGETFVCRHEPHNSYDIYAIGVYSSTDKLVGHLPRELGIFTILHNMVVLLVE